MEKPVPGESIQTAEEKFARSVYWSEEVSRIVSEVRRHPFDDALVLAHTTGLPHGILHEANYLFSATLECRRAVHDAYEAFSKLSLDQHKPIAQIAYEQAARYGVPQKEAAVIEFSRKQNPLFITLVVSEEAAGPILGRGILGHFVSQSVVFDGKRAIRYPLVVIGSRDEDRETVRRHEEFHWVNWMVWRSLEAVNKHKIWGSHLDESGKFRQNLANYLNTNWKSVEKGLLAPEELQNRPEWRDVVNHCLAMAKNEFLCQLFSRGDIVNHLGIMIQQGAGYDYLDHFPLDSEGLISLLHADYSKNLQDSTGIAESVDHFYDTLNFNYRRALLPWQLMQIPMQDWGKGLEDIGINGEIKYIEDLMAWKNGKKDRALMERFGNWLASGGSDKDWIINEHLENMRDNQNKSFLPELEKCRADLQRFF